MMMPVIYLHWRNEEEAVSRAVGENQAKEENHSDQASHDECKRDRMG
jgi:hypothetical protein